MTQEQKANAYDEALKVIKANLDALNEITTTGAEAVNIQAIKNCFYKAFPELRESEGASEDERVRKAILYFIKRCPDARKLPTKEYSKWVEYLEKQKNKPTSVIEILARAGLKPYKDGNQWCILAGDNIQEGICGFGDTIDEALYQFLMDVLEKQQPAKKWSKEDARILYNVIAYIGYAAGQRGVRDDEFKEANAWLKSLPNGFVVNPNYNEDMVNLLVAELQQDAERNGAPQQYVAEIDWLKSLRPQPKVEWSKVDKEMLYAMIDIVSNSLYEPLYPREEMLAWLKSLQPQLKPEWTEKDESMLNLIITDVSLGQRKCGIGTDEWNARSKAVRWIKSLPKRFNLQPQPQPEQQPTVKLTGWVARDFDGDLFFIDQKPDRKGLFWVNPRGQYSAYLKRNWFPDLKWKDEPVEVELTIKKK